LWSQTPCPGGHSGGAVSEQLIADADLAVTRPRVPAAPPTGSPPPRRREDARSDNVLPA